MKIDADWLQNYLTTPIRVYKGWDMKSQARRIAMEDGGIMSVQASATHYCSPKNNEGPYSSVEVGFPVGLKGHWAEMMGGQQDDNIFGWVPIENVVEVINFNGGVKDE